MTFLTRIHMSLKVIHTSIQIDFNHKSESKLIKTINLMFHSRNCLGWLNLDQQFRACHWYFNFCEFHIFELSSFMLKELITYSLPYQKLWTKVKIHKICKNVNTLCIKQNKNRITKYPYFNLPQFFEQHCAYHHSMKQGHMLSNTIKNNFWSANWKSWGGKDTLMRSEKFTIKNC